MDKRETLKKLFLENGLEKEDVFKSPQGYVIITRSGIEKIQYKNKIEISFTSEMLAKDFVVIKATGTKKLVTEKGIQYDLQIETYGEASPENCKNKYIPKPELIGVWFESMIEGMIECASIDERLRHSLIIELRDGLTWQRANEIKRFLEDYQPDPITQGSKYTLSDITRKLKQIVNESK